MQISQPRFSIAAARRAVGATAYIGYDTSAREAFDFLSAKSPNTVRILDLSNPQVGGYRILQEEIHGRAGISETSGLLPLTGKEVQRLEGEELLADGIICASSFSRQCLIEDGVSQDRIRVVPYGVDLARFRPRERSTTKKDVRVLRLLFMGPLYLGKGIYELIDAMHALARNDIRLTVAGAVHGDTGYFENLGSNIHLLGRVAFADVPEVYTNNDVLVLPSLVDGFGQVLLEALASGLPIIGSNHTAAPDLLEEGDVGWVVPAGNAEALASCIGYCADHPDEVREKRSVTRVVAEAHSWSRYYDEVAVAVRSLVEQTHCRCRRVSPPSERCRPC